MSANSSESVEALELQGYLDIGVAVGLFIFTGILVLFYEFSCYLLIKVTQRNDLIMAKVLEYATKLNMACIPFHAIVLPGLIGLFPVSAIVGTWFCDITTFLQLFVGNMNAGLSVITISMSYIGFVHEAKAKRFGKQSLNNLFCALTIGIPLVMAINFMPATMHHLTYNLPITDSCYGRPPTKNGPPCTFDDDELQQKYGYWTHAVKTGLQISCWLNFVLMSVFYSNIPEIILYILTYLHLKRYVSLKEQFDICFPILPFISMFK